jgi:hypothetical protein
MFPTTNRTTNSTSNECDIVNCRNQGAQDTAEFESLIQAAEVPIPGGTKLRSITREAAFKGFTESTGSEAQCIGSWPGCSPTSKGRCCCYLDLLDKLSTVCYIENNNRSRGLKSPISYSNKDSVKRTIAASLTRACWRTAGHDLTHQASERFDEQIEC